MRIQGKSKRPALRFCGYDVSGACLRHRLLCGDVMTERGGIDQILPHLSDPRIYEPQVSNARAYVALTEEVNGPIPRPVEFPCVWGDSLAALTDGRSG
jgi:hypothetical protein